MNRLTAEQEQAVTSRDRDILVEAGAGSGKTSTTVERYMRLIEGELEPSQILVFTFTEKAATELRERVRDRRQEQDESFSMSSAWIGTFHAICGSILRSHPIQADIDPAFAILDDIRSSRLKGDAYDAALADFTTTPEREAIMARFTPSHLREGIFNAFEQLRSRGISRPAPPQAGPSSRKGIVEDLLAEAERALATEGIRKPLPQTIEALIEALRDMASDSVTYEEMGRACFESGSKKIPRLIEAMKIARGRLAAVEFGDDIRAGLDELLQLYGDRYAEAKRSSNSLDFEDLQLKTVELLAGNPSISALYTGRFEEIMVDEFQDTNKLQLELIESLRGPDTRLFTVGDEMQAIYGFRHADVRLFRTRRDNPDVTVLPLSANFRSQAPVIGAVNQIGRELDRDVSNLRDEVDHEARHKVADLRVGLEPGDYDGGEVELLFTEKDSWAGLDLGPLSPAIDLDEHDVPAGTGNCEAEALLVAHHLKATIDSSGISPSETAILFKTKANIPVYAAALRQAGLSPYVVGGTGFWESREGIEIRSLLGVIANPLDDESLLGVLTGPACGLSTDALLLLKQLTGQDQPLWHAIRQAVDGVATDPSKAPMLELLSARDLGRATAFVATIDSLRDRAAVMPLGELVEAAVTETGYDLANLQRDPEAGGLANARRIASLAADFETTEGRDLRGLLEWIELSASLDTEAAVATQEEDSEVVRLMTIHKAKGLEFDLVCVADLARKGKGAGESVFWIGDPSPGSGAELSFGLRLNEPDGETLDLYEWVRLSKEAKAEKVDEDLRLFHVALTRARRRLVVSGIFNLEKADSIEDSAPLIGRLASALKIGPDDPEAVSVDAPEGLDTLERRPEASQMRVLRNDANEDQAEHLRRVGDNEAVRQPIADGRAPLRRPDRPSHQNVPLSFSALNEFRECPSRFYATRILRLEDPEEARGEEDWRSGESPLDPEVERLNLRNEGTRFGTALHEIFERAAGRRWVIPTEKEVAGHLASAGVDPDGGQTLSRAMGMIEGFIDSDLAARLKPKRSEIEIPVLVEIRGVTIRGFADLLVRDLDPPLIVDYKTNRLDGKTPREKLEDYELQRDLYGLAVHQALEAPVVETAFVFLEEPDDPATDLMDAGRLAEGEERIADLIEEITMGRFFGGPEAIHQPCGKCWACETLKVQRERALAA